MIRKVILDFFQTCGELLSKPIVVTVTTLLSIAVAILLPVWSIFLNANCTQINPILAGVLIFFSSAMLFFGITSYFHFQKNQIPTIKRSFFTNEQLEKKIQDSKISIQFVFIYMQRLDFIMEAIIKKMRKDRKFVVELYIVKRKRIPYETSYLRLRQADEYSNNDSVKGMNKNLFEIFTTLLDYSHDNLITIRNFQVKEYDFMPSICLYIFDKQDLVFGPYIAKTCEDIPLIEIRGSPYKDWPANPANDVVSAYINIKTHFKILGGTYPKKPRMNKQYPRRFSFWDGYHNVPLHALIMSCSDELNNLLSGMNLISFSDFLEEDNELFRDDIMDALGIDSDEGRFDALMRHLSDSLDAVPDIRDCNNIPECIELITHFGVRSCMNVIKNKDRHRHIDRLKNILERIATYQLWLVTTQKGDGIMMSLEKFRIGISEFSGLIAGFNLSPDMHTEREQRDQLEEKLKSIRRSRRDILHTFEREIIRKMH